MSEDSPDFVYHLKRLLKGTKGLVRMPSASTRRMSTCRFHDMPESLILRIFYFLPIRVRLYLRRVSWKWHELLFDFSIWKQIDLNEEDFLAYRVKKNIFLKWIAHFGRTIQVIDVSEIEWITDSEIALIARQCKNLRCLNVKGCNKVTESGIHEIANNCRLLEKINIYYTAVSDRGFHLLACKCPYLKHAKLGSRGNCYNMVSSICDHCTDVMGISIHDVVTFGVNDPNVDDDLVERLAWSFAGLEYLNLTWCCFVTDHSLFSIARYCVNLRTLRLRECQQVSDRGVRATLRMCSKLENLELDRLYEVADLTYSSASEPESFPNLRSLRIFDTKMTDETVAKISERCPNLRKFEFGEYCSRITHIKGDNCIPTVAYSCRNLRLLSAYPEYITDDDLFAIGKNLTELLDLSLGDCSHCTENGVFCIARNCRQLMSMTIRNCNAIGDSQLTKIRKFLPYLVKLYLPGNGRISHAWFALFRPQANDHRRT